MPVYREDFLFFSMNTFLLFFFSVKSLEREIFSIFLQEENFQVSLWAPMFSKIEYRFLTFFPNRVYI